MYMYIMCTCRATRSSRRPSGLESGRGDAFYSLCKCTYLLQLISMLRFTYLCF